MSLGQTNTVVLCPALTSHSELAAEALRAAGISPTTIRIAVGDEDPRTLLAHFIRAAELALDPDPARLLGRLSRARPRSTPSGARPTPTTHRRYAEAQPSDGGR